MNFSETTKLSLLYMGAANAVNCDVVDLSDFQRGSLIVLHTGAGDTDLVLSLYEATTVGGSTSQAITTAVPIYHNLSLGTSGDTLSATTGAYSYTIDTGVAPNRMVVFEIDPVSILSDGYKCITLSDSGGNSANTVCILFAGIPRLASASLPSAIA